MAIRHSGSISDWREFYHTGNLTPATASAAGLMSAADKTKLDGIADGGMKLLGAGVVDGAGQLKKRMCLLQMLFIPEVPDISGFSILSTIPITRYRLPAKQHNGGNGYASIRAKTATYFDVWTADDETANDVSFFFQIYATYPTNYITVDCAARCHFGATSDHSENRAYNRPI
ncbi:hypothetical protein [Rikenella microfusus]|uniref:hypothetical protein n=1 Tax=Rikenella microfusus TaxID=28139 RepID=UPI001DD34DD2|nr:hypothetical protein [Rikenella microfusus]HJE87622.1 hypothetical protein [Rikenella microfusus]